MSKQHPVLVTCTELFEIGFAMVFVFASGSDDVLSWSGCLRVSQFPVLPC